VYSISEKNHRVISEILKGEAEPNYAPIVFNLLHVTLLAPRILRLFLEIWRTCVTLNTYVHLYTEPSRRRLKVVTMGNLTF
jgi:hypothetical protein